MLIDMRPSAIRLLFRIVKGIPKLRQFLGLRASTALVIGCVAGLAQGLAEIGMAAFLQLFLRETKLLESSIELPWPLQAWHPSIVVLSASLVSIGILRSVNQFLMGQASTIANERINVRLRLMLLDRVLRAEHNNIIPISYSNTLMSSIFPVASAVFAHIAASIPNVVMVGALIYAMQRVAPMETLLGIIGIGILGLVVNRINKGIARIAKQRPIEEADLSRSIVRVTRNWLLVKILRTEKLELDRMQGNVLRQERVALRTNFWIQFSGVLPSSCGAALIALIVAVSRAYWTTSGLALLSFLYLFLRFVQVFSGVVTSVAHSCGGSSQFMQAWRFFFQGGGNPDLIVTEAERRFIDGNTAGNRAIVGDTGTIRHGERPPGIRGSNLQFVYEDGLPLAVDTTEFNVLPGSQLAIIGPSGSGKSTLLTMILGILRPTGGSLYIDDVSPVDYFTQPRQIGYVGAEPFLISGSILQNITYGLRSPVSEADCWEALKMAKMFQFVNSLPNKMEYQIREDGSGLSAGQKQRIALARAFLAKPSLLILDEATANLDSETEREIVSAISTLRGLTTTIVVSHREAALIGADQKINLSAPS